MDDRVLDLSPVPPPKENHMRLILSMAFVIAAAGLFVASAGQAAPPDKITICHAAGLDGTTHFIELNLPPNAVYGQNDASGHFNEDGSTAAGHEDDHLGPCDDKPEPPKDPDPKAQAI